MAGVAEPLAAVINGVAPDVLDRMALAEGRRFSDSDFEGAGNMAIISDMLAGQIRKSVPGKKLLGENIQLGETTFRIVGVLKNSWRAALQCLCPSCIGRPANCKKHRRLVWWMFVWWRMFRM